MENSVVDENKEVVKEVVKQQEEQSKQSEFYSAFVNAQNALANVQIYRTKKGYNYTYTPLEDILSVLLPIISKNGLGIMQYPIPSDSNTISIVTRLFHKNGFYVDFNSIMPFANDNSKINTSQNYGAALTYLKRYCITSIFGIATEDDTDGNFNNANNAQVKPKQTQQAVKPIEKDVETVKQTLTAMGLKFVQSSNVLQVTSNYNDVAPKREQLKQLGFVFDSEHKSWVVRVA